MNDHDNDITEVAQLRDHMGEAADNGNIFLATSTAVHDEFDNEMKHLSYGKTLQIEGFVLGPRHLVARRVDIVTEDRDEADYILQIVRSSQAPLAERQADAVALASQRLPGYTGLPLKSLSGLGEMVEALNTANTPGGREES